MGGPWRLNWAVKTASSGRTRSPFFMSHKVDGLKGQNWTIFLWNGWSIRLWFWANDYEIKKWTVSRVRSSTSRDRPLHATVQFHYLDHSTRKNGRTVKLLYFTLIYLYNSTGMNDVNFTGRKWYNSGKSKLKLPAISKITGYSGVFPILLYKKDWSFCIILLKIE